MSGALDWLSGREPDKVYIPPVEQIEEDPTIDTLKTKKRASRNSLVIDTNNPGINITGGSGLQI